MRIVSFIFCFIISLYVSANNIKPSDPSLKSKANEWIKNKPAGFTENKGQMTDMDNKPVPFVLFKTEAPGLDLYITEKGLTYVFIKIIKEKINDSSSLKEMHMPDYLKNEKTSMEWNRIDMLLKGANIKKENIIKETQSEHFYQYFLGHCPDGVTDVHSYEKIIIKEIYPGIDWVLYNTNDKGLKYDFIVHPGADAKQIEMVYSSLEPVKLNTAGELELNTAIGNLKEQSPYSYIKETNQKIESSFKITSTKKIKEYYETTIQFEIGDLNISKSQTFIIDPQLVWSTLFGGGSNLECISGLECDQNGNVFATGGSGGGIGFPNANNIGASTYFQNYTSVSFNVFVCLFIIKFNNKGVLLWATYYGNPGFNTNSFSNGTSLCIDLSGNIFITGITDMLNFPLFNPGSGAYFQSTFAGGTSNGSIFDPHDMFLLKFSNNGVRLWATYYGGSGNEKPYSICTDNIGNIFITGEVDSNNFPTLNSTSGSYYQNIKKAYDDAFIIKFNNTGVRLWSTFYGGDGWDEGQAICCDALGNVFVAGNTSSTNLILNNPGGGTYFQNIIDSIYYNTFILKFNNSGVLIWATYFGGNHADRVNSICIDGKGNLFITGYTGSSNFPVLNPLNGAYFQGTLNALDDNFILKFNNSGVLIWSTYYGGNGSDYISGANDNISIDECNNLYINFTTTSSDLPIKNNCSGGYNDSTLSATRDYYVVKFNNYGKLLWSTYFVSFSYGSPFSSIAVDKYGNLFVTGTSRKTNFISVDPGGGTYFIDTNTLSTSYDFFISKFAPLASPLIQDTLVNNSCNCNGSATVNVGGCAPYDITWYNNSWTQIDTGQSISNLCQGTYQVIVKDTISCPSFDTAYVTISSIVSLTNSQTNVSCNGGNDGSATVNASGGTPGYTYSWVPSGGNNATANNLIAGTYTVTVTDQAGCIATQTFTITQPAALVSSINGTNTICIGQNTTLTANVNANVNYLWSNSATTSSITVSPNTTTTYSLVVTNNLGCKDTAFVTVTVVPFPVALITGQDTICRGDNVLLTANGGGTYIWNTNETTTSINVTPTSITSYSVSVSNGVCASTASITIVPQGPIVSAGPNVTITGGNSTQLSGSGIGTYNWTPSNGLSCNNCTNPIANPLQTTTYTLTVTDSNGCSAKSAVTITVECGDFEVPNAFSPNGDNQNDIFILQGWGNRTKEISFQIFNRLGEKVFESNNVSLGWDGNYNGTPLNSAVFVYVIKAELYCGETIVKKGNITLIK